MNNANKATYLLVPLSLGWALMSAPVNAQTAQAAERSGPDQVTEIIVTAQKREQSINDVGMSINAISADALSNQRLTTVADLTRVVPALSVVPALKAHLFTHCAASASTPATSQAFPRSVSTPTKSRCLIPI